MPVLKMDECLVEALKHCSDHETFMQLARSLDRRCPGLLPLTLAETENTRYSLRKMAREFIIKAYKTREVSEKAYRELKSHLYLVDVTAAKALTRVWRKNDMARVQDQIDRTQAMNAVLLQKCNAAIKLLEEYTSVTRNLPYRLGTLDDRVTCLERGIGRIRRGLFHASDEHAYSDDSE